MMYRPEGRSEALAAKGNGIDVDISGSIVDSVAESRSATCARCNARGAVDGAQEMARHASGTISQWWFRFLEQDRGTRGAEARKEMIWLAASGAPASSKQAGKKIFPWLLLNVRILHVALTCKSTSGVCLWLNCPGLVQNWLARGPQERGKKGENRFPHAPRRAGGFFSSRAWEWRVVPGGKRPGRWGFLGPAQRTGRGSICLATVVPLAERV